MRRLIAALVLTVALLTASPGCASAGDNHTAEGASLFSQHCAGYHINGGNIIRRNKNLKLTTLQRRGLDSVDAIAQIAREGVGMMSGYEVELGPGNDRIVATWILEQAQNAWIQG